MKIQSTVKYEQFYNNPKQREFKTNRVQDLVQKMKTNGFLSSAPISVFRKGGKLIINTGHHRLAAAKSLGIPVLYVIEDEWTTKQMIEEGFAGSSWSNSDAVSNWAHEGLPDYQELMEWAHKGIPLAMAASMLAGEGAGSSNTIRLTKSGEFKIKTREQISTISEIIEEFGDRVPAVKDRSFIATFSKCLFTPEFDPDRFVKKLRTNPAMMDKAGTNDQMLKQIEDIYNFKTPNKMPVAFLVDQNSRNRRATFGKSSANETRPISIN